MTDFLNFLRGMETSQHQQTPFRPRSFLNFLRGMETVSAYRGQGIGAPLPKLP